MRANTNKREERRKEEEEEEEDYRYGTTKFEYGYIVWNFILCMVWVWKLPISFLVRINLRRALRILDMCFRKGVVAS